MQQRTSQWVKLSDQSFDEYLTSPEIIDAAEQLQKGELVAFPTETVYGLGADATSQQAVSKVYQAKGRPSDNPLIVHFAETEQAKRWIKTASPSAEQLMEAFWPGPLTLVVQHDGGFAEKVTADLPTIAVRVPSHPVARALIQSAGLPIAAPSANRSGRPSPTTAAHVWNDLAEQIALLLDAGAAEVGVESTVVDITGKHPVLLRPGGITVEAIEEQIGPILIDPGLQNEHIRPRSPGMKYRHYAPDGELWLVYGRSTDHMMQIIQQIVDEARGSGKKVGILTTEEQANAYLADVVVTCGRRHDPESVAQRLYQSLHQLNTAKVDLIIAETFPEQGVFYSVMNRLKKAANKQVK